MSYSNGGWDQGSNIDQYAFDYMREQLIQNEEFADLDEIDKVSVLLIIEDALQYYYDGCYRKFLLRNNGNNSEQ